MLRLGRLSPCHHSGLSVTRWSPLGRLRHPTVRHNIGTTKALTPFSVNSGSTVPLTLPGSRSVSSQPRLKEFQLGTVNGQRVVHGDGGGPYGDGSGPYGDGSDSGYYSEDESSEQRESQREGTGWFRRLLKLIMAIPLAILLNHGIDSVIEALVYNKKKDLTEQVVQGKIPDQLLPSNPEQPSRLKIVKHGKHNLLCNTMGRGSPTVVINGDSIWAVHTLQSLISRFTTCVSYTKAGLNYDSTIDERRSKSWTSKIEPFLSQTPVAPRTDPRADSDSESQELVAVLRGLRIDDDVLLVSTNYNWFSTLKAAQRNSDHVSGVIMINPLLPFPVSPTLPSMLRRPNLPILTMTHDPEFRFRAKPAFYQANSLLSYPVRVSHLYNEAIACSALFHLSPYGIPSATHQFDRLFTLDDSVRHLAASWCNYQEDPRVLYLAKQHDLMMLEGEYRRLAHHGKVNQTLEEFLEKNSTMEEQVRRESGSCGRAHYGLLGWVQETFGDRAPSPPSFPIKVIVPLCPRPTPHTLRRRSFLNLFGVDVSLSEDEVALRNRLKDASHLYASSWSKALPSSLPYVDLKWCQTMNVVGAEPHVPNWSNVVAEIQASVLQYRSNRYGIGKKTTKPTNAPSR